VSAYGSGRVALEGEWIGLCRAGDMAAWRALYDRYLPLVYRVARRMGVPEGDCRDLCQDVFLRVYRGLGTFRGEAQFSTWLYRITLHEATRAGRARAVRNALLALLGREPAPPALSDRRLARVEAADELEQILRRLKPKHRQVVVLFELEQLPLDHVAETLGCPLETVRSRLRHAWVEFERVHRQRRLSAGGGAP
jgi:RNA polymerase sigma-70 factor, ECF subfamily